MHPTADRQPKQRADNITNGLEGSEHQQQGRRQKQLSIEWRVTETYWGREDELVGADKVGVGEADSHGRLRRHPAVEGVHADALTVCDVDHLDPARQYKIL